MVAVAQHRHGDMAASRDSKTVRAFCEQMGQKSAVRSSREAGQAIEMMVGVAGFEPATPASRTDFSTCRRLILLRFLCNYRGDLLLLFTINLGLPWAQEQMFPFDRTGVSSIGPPCLRNSGRRAIETILPPRRSAHSHFVQHTLARSDSAHVRHRGLVKRHRTQSA
ncbi:hypothetical protein [Bradyrhizobium sp. USDA 4449]